MEITRHAYERAKQRFKLKPDSLNRLANRALETGICHADTKGRLNKFVTKLYFHDRTANNVRIYGQYVFIFSGETLITIYQLPNNLRKAVKKNGN